MAQGGHNSSYWHTPAGEWPARSPEKDEITSSRWRWRGPRALKRPAPNGDGPRRIGGATLGDSEAPRRKHAPLQSDAQWPTTSGGEAASAPSGAVPASGSAGAAGRAPGSGNTQRRLSPQSASFRHPALKKF